MGSILWVRRVSSAVRLRFWPDVAGQKLAPRFEGPGTGVVWDRSPPGIAAWGQPVGAMPGLGWRREGSRRWPGEATRCGSLTGREVSFGGAWPGSRVRYDEGDHSGRFRLG